MLLTIERRLKSCHFVEKTPKTPDIGLVAVGLAAADLGGEVVRGADRRGGQVQRVRQPLGEYSLTNIFAANLRNPEVADLDEALGGEEDVLGLEVAVEDVLLVDVLQREGDLDEPGQDLLLRQVLLQHLPLLLYHLDGGGGGDGGGGDGEGDPPTLARSSASANSMMMRIFSSCRPCFTR